MDHEAVHNVIRSRFKTQVEVPQSVPTQYDNAPFATPDNATYVRWAIQDGHSRQADTGGGTTTLFRQVGVATASVFAPIKSGNKDSLTLTDAIVTAFRKVTDTQVVFRTPSVTTIGATTIGSAVESGPRWQTNVSCPFYHDNLV